MEVLCKPRVGVSSNACVGYGGLLYLLWAKFLGSYEDLTRLAEKFWPRDQGALEKLISIRQQIQQTIFEVFGIKPFALNSSFHFVPGDIYEALLAKSNAQLALRPQEGVTLDMEETAWWFMYGVYYQRLHDEQPYLLKPCFPLDKLLDIPLAGQTSWAFHENLSQKLQSPDWQQKLRERFPHVVCLDFISDGTIKEIIHKRICDAIISVLQDYQDFFGNFSLRPIFEANTRVLQICQENWDFLNPVFEKLGTTKEEVDSLVEQFVAATKAQFRGDHHCQMRPPVLPFKLLCLGYFILGGLQHIGLEYGKYNKVREDLDLPSLPEPTDEHRFHLVTFDGNGEYDFGFYLKLLIGETSEIVKAAASGGKDALFCLTQRQSIRVRAADFFIKADKNGLFFQLERQVVLDKSEFIGLMKILDIWDQAQIAHLNDSQRTLGDWLADLKNLELVETFRVRIFSLLLDSYVDGSFNKISRSLPSNISERLKIIFLNSSFIEQVSRQENSDHDTQPPPRFFGIKPVINLPRIYSKETQALPKIACIALLQEYVLQGQDNSEFPPLRKENLVREVVRLLKKPEY